MTTTATLVKSEPIAATMPMDIDDEIVREIDVFVSPELSKQLYMLQFPLQHQQPDLPDAARVKPHHGLLELEQSLPLNIGSDGAYYLAKRKYDSQTIPISTHLALGKMMPDNKLHLIPLQHITQMRPSFAHVDESDPQNQISVAPSPESTAVDEKKPLLFQKKESERAALARKSSYAYKTASEDAEEWSDLTIRDIHSPEFSTALEKIPCKDESTVIQVSTKNYVKSLNYLPNAVTEILDDDEPMPRDEKPLKGSSAGADHQASLIKLVQRLTKMMHRGVPVSYSVLRPQFPGSISHNDLLTALSSCTILVRGNFYLQSRLLGWDIMVARARTFCLYILHTRGLVQRIGMEAAFEDTVGKEWMELILKQVALKTPHRCWKPRISDYADMYIAFSEQTALHNQYWERQGRKFTKELELYDATIIT